MLMVLRAIATNTTRAQYILTLTMQMSTSSYFTVFQGARTLWNYLRKKEAEPEASDHEMRMKDLREAHEASTMSAHHDHELAMIRAKTVRKVAAAHAEASAHLAEGEARSRASRLAPAMAAFETVQAKKRARLMAAKSDRSIEETDVAAS